MSSEATNSREPNGSLMSRTVEESLTALEKYPADTVMLVTQDFGYHPGTTVEDLRTYESTSGEFRGIGWLSLPPS